MVRELRRPPGGDRLIVRMATARSRRANEDRRIVAVPGLSDGRTWRWNWSRPWTGLVHLAKVSRRGVLLPVSLSLIACGGPDAPAPLRDEAVEIRRGGISQAGSICRMVVLLRPSSLQSSLLWLRQTLAIARPSCAALAVYAAPSDTSLIENLEYTTVVGIAAGRDEKKDWRRERYERAVSARTKKQESFVMGWRIGSATRVAWQWNGELGEVVEEGLREQERILLADSEFRLLYWWTQERGTGRSAAFYFHSEIKRSAAELAAFTESFAASIGCRERCIVCATFTSSEAVLSDPLFPLHNQMLLRRLPSWSAVTKLPEFMCSTIDGNRAQCLEFR